ncbi:MAG TPA: trans-aconitate 2-methyltransferase [Jiangellaceae bacterium]|nr:trans-aconitate 2-methyltransferase [Jiangellaceae bacterium]
MWDPQRYLTREAERARPFHDLVVHIGANAPRRVVDLGCGPGHLTMTLAERWPDAEVVGVDSSAEMVEAAREVAGIEVIHADLRDWEPSAPVDVLVSNAVLQWVPGHLDLLPRLAGWLAPGGWLAFQVPGNYREPVHVLLRELADSVEWRDRLGADRVTRAGVCEPADYLDVLAGLGLPAEVWETTYLHVLQGEDAVLDWMTGTALRPVLAALDAEVAAAFVAQYGDMVRAAYPERPYGTVLPFRRIFAVARRQP